MTRPGMGRGLAAILPESGDRRAAASRACPIEMIRRNPRPAANRASTRTTIKALAASIADAGRGPAADRPPAAPTAATS